MTKEERAKKWFCNIPDAESISLETKINICNKAAKRMIIIFFVLFTVECILLFMLSDGKIFDFMADFLNNISDGSPTRNHYRGMALIGGIACLPIIALPLIVVLIYKNKCLQAEVAKIIDIMKNNDTRGQNITDFIEKSTEDFLHFDNINFKLAIVQTLMYDLKLLEPSFDIYDFANQYKDEEIDTESYTIIKPALNYFRNLPIPKKFASQVETIYMDGGNEVYMNLIPQWDGEDGCFDLNEVTLTELEQFPNLKQATIMSSNFDKIKETFDAANIEVELL
ncbi:MAG: DUF6892 domain-containing protein [Catonella sp.]|uniref:DUF6892 domain-containing protein n=1 Tax=Catonella sp. TaxID=2382125 RepID=UPI003FA0E244